MIVSVSLAWSKNPPRISDTTPAPVLFMRMLTFGNACTKAESATIPLKTSCADPVCETEVSTNNQNSGDRLFMEKVPLTTDARRAYKVDLDLWPLLIVARRHVRHPIW